MAQPWFQFQHPGGSLQPSYLQFSRFNTLSWPLMAPGTFIHKYRQNTHIHKVSKSYTCKI